MTHDEIEQKQLEVQRGCLEVEQGKLTLAQEAFQLERKKVEETLQLERQKYESQSEIQRKTLDLEERKVRRTNPVVVAVIAAGLGFIANALIERWTASDNFKLKAAEIVMNSSGVDATRERAEALQKLFHNELPENFATALHASKPAELQPGEPRKPDLAGDPEAKKALIKLLAEHPTQREQIINDWLAVFTDEWAECLKTPDPCR